MTRIQVPFPVRPEVAFDFLADPRHRPKWQSSLRSIELLDDGPPEIGMRWRDRTLVGAAPELRITRYERPRRWNETGTWHGITADLDLDFAADGDGTLVVAELAIHGAGHWALPAGALARLAPIGVRSDLRRAARHLARS